MISHDFFFLFEKTTSEFKRRSIAKKNNFDFKKNDLDMTLPF